MFEEITLEMVLNFLFYALLYLLFFAVVLTTIFQKLKDLGWVAPANVGEALGFVSIFVSILTTVLGYMGAEAEVVTLTEWAVAVGTPLAVAFFQIISNKLVYETLKKARFLKSSKEY